MTRGFSSFLPSRLPEHGGSSVEGAQLALLAVEWELRSASARAPSIFITTGPARAQACPQSWLGWGDFFQCLGRAEVRRSQVVGQR